LATKVPNVSYIATNAGSQIVYGEDGTNVDAQMSTVDGDYPNVFSQVQLQQNMSVYDAISTVAPAKLADKFFMFRTSFDAEFETSSNIRDLSAMYGSDDAKFGGEESLIVSRYQAFPEYLSQHQNIKVLLNHAVNKVTSTGENSSTVTCSNGKTFTATKVIIAAPLGVLKRNAITF
jgi:hypothetical protein